MSIFLCVIYWLLKILVVLTALTVLLSFTVAWYERANSAPDLIDRRFTMRGLGITVWLIVQETACLLITFVLRPFGWLSPKMTGDQTCVKPPIILVHGLFQNRSSLYWLGYCLRKAGFANVYSINTPPWKDLEAVTEILTKKIDETRLVLNLDQVILVGHSMGGIIGRNYVQHRGGSAKVAHLVTLGSPHQGSKLAPFAISTMGRSLLPDSEFLSHFNTGPLPTETRFTAIYTRYDNIVLPAQNCRLEGATNIELDGMGHTALLFHPRAIQAIIDALTEPQT